MDLMGKRKMFFIGPIDGIDTDDGMLRDERCGDFTFTPQVQATITTKQIGQMATTWKQSKNMRSSSVPDNKPTAAGTTVTVSDEEEGGQQQSGENDEERRTTEKEKTEAEEEDSGEFDDDSDDDEAGTFYDQSDVERDDYDSGEEDEAYDDFDKDNFGTKGKQPPPSTATTALTVPSNADAATTTTLSKSAPPSHKSSMIEPPTFTRKSRPVMLIDELHMPAPLRDYEAVCTIGTGTFGRVLLVKSKTKTTKQAVTTKDRDENKENNKAPTNGRRASGVESSLDFGGGYFALKMMSMRCVIATKQVEHVHSEKNILLKLTHPFIVNLHWVSRDDKCLYMMFDYAPGGELFSYLRASGRFGNTTTRFYATEITSALEYMHRLNIVYRDLKPENLLLDKDGHLKITDFGFAKELSDRTWTLCGTPEYLAPEVIANKGHNKAVDWWALGVLIYEMHAGFPPYCGNNALAIYNKILEGKLKFPQSFNLTAKDLVRKLLQTDRTKRIGSMKDGASDVKKHKWFQGIDWKDVNEKKTTPPIVPTLYHDGDTGNFDAYEEEDCSRIKEVAESDRELFKDW